MITLEQAFAAGASKPFGIPGRFFRVLDSEGPVTLTFYKQYGQVGKAENVEAGFGWSGDLDTDTLFDSVTIHSATAQTVKIAVSEFPVSYDRGAASVDVQSLPTSATAFSSALVTAIAASVVAAVANAARKFLMLTNLSSATVYVNLAGGVATSNDFPLAVGASLILDRAVPSNAVAIYCATAGAVLAVTA